MTAEPDLLPLPEWYESCGPTVKRDLRDYARANVAHATAARNAEVERLKGVVRGMANEIIDKQAEVEGVRAEVERLNRIEFCWGEWLEKTEWVQQTCKPKELGMHRADIMRLRLEQAEARAERLAGALRPLVMAVEALKFDIFRLATPELKEAFDGRNVVSVVQQSTTQPLRNALLAARAALEQENDDA